MVFMRKSQASPEKVVNLDSALAVNRPIVEATRDTVLMLRNSITEDATKLKEMYSERELDIKSIRGLEAEINKNARMAGSIIITFRDELETYGQRYSLTDLNMEITEIAKNIYLGCTKCVTYHSLADVPSKHIRGAIENHKPGDDAGSILKYFGDKLGENFEQALQKMGIDPKRFSEVLAELSELKHANRDSISQSVQSGPSMRVSDRKENTEEVAQLTPEEINRINKNLEDMASG